MAETLNPTISGETVQTGSGNPTLSQGSLGLETQMPGHAATVSNLANATGGIGAGHLVEPDLDAELFKFKSDDTPLMNLMLKAKKVKVSSPEVEHYMIDEPRSSVLTTEAVAESTAQQAVLPLAAEDQNIPRPYGTLLAKGVDGYMPDGQTLTPGKDLMLFVTGHDSTTGNPIVRAVNGKKASPADEYCQMPAIPAGTTMVILSNALYETQKEVDPDLIVPQPTLVYLQKRGMNQVVSDYFDAQRKHIPFTKAILAEQAITNFKVRGNRTLWAGRKSKFKVSVPKMGLQMVYTTEGVRWQFKRELQHTGKWTVEKIIALAKMFYTGEDVPKTSLLLAGKNFLENIQCIDYTKHPEIQITSKTNPIGWTVTNFHTVFGDIEIKHDPTLDRLGWSNSGALIAHDRLVHYQYSAEHSFNDRVEGEEATRTGILVWDALALKGSAHIWIDGDGDNSSNGATSYVMWDSEEAPADTDLVEGQVYYLLQSCPGISSGAASGEMWQYKDGKWVEFKGDVYAD